MVKGIKVTNLYSIIEAILHNAGSNIHRVYMYAKTPSYTTVTEIINILHKRGFLKKYKKGREYEIYPLPQLKEFYILLSKYMGKEVRKNAKKEES